MESIKKIRSKILDRNGLGEVLKKDRADGKKIIFTNGCFDILHRGHLEYLARASDLLTLASFEFVDFVVLFNEDTPCELMRVLRPDVWVKGGDYKNVEELPEYRVMMEIEGEVIILPFVEGFSSTHIFKKIQGSAENQDEN